MPKKRISVNIRQVITNISCDDDTFGLVGISVIKSGCLARFPADQPRQVGPDFVLATAFHCVALRALLHEDLLSLFDVTHLVL